MKLQRINNLMFCNIIILTLVFIVSASFVENSKLSWPKQRYRNFEHFLEEKSRHVCLTEHVYGGSRRQYSSECMNSVPTKICGKKTYIRYHCCAGFQFEHPISEGCYLVQPTVNLEDTMNSLYLIEMEKYFNNGKNFLAGKNLLTQNNSTLTVFVPQNQAFKNLTQQLRNQLRQNSENNLLLLHVANFRLTSSQMQNNKNISTLYGQDLHVHRYANGIITVNCVRIIRPNLLATNGIIHIVEDIIKPIANNANLMESLERRQDAKLFVSALRSTGVDKQLIDASNHYTVILPTDEAIKKLGKRWDRIKNDPQLLKKFVLYHIIDCCICSSSLLGPYFPRSLEGEKIRMDCNIDDAISFNDIIASQLDHVTTNGIIHTIDEVLLPTSVLTVKEKLDDLGHHGAFLNFSDQIGLSETLEGRQASDFVTIFAPSDEAFEKANKTEDSQWLNRRKEIELMMNSYIVDGDYSTSKLVGLKSLEAGLRQPKSQIDINMHDNVFYINNAKIVKPDIRVSNGIIHVVDFIITPKKKKVPTATLR